MAALTFALGALVVLAVVYGPRLWRRLRRRGRMVECTICGRPLPAAKAVRVVSAEAMPDGMGGTAMVAEYHKRCQPKG